MFRQDRRAAENRGPPRQLLSFGVSVTGHVHPFAVRTRPKIRAKGRLQGKTGKDAGIPSIRPDGPGRRIFRKERRLRRSVPQVAKKAAGTAKDEAETHLRLPSQRRQVHPRSQMGPAPPRGSAGASGQRQIANDFSVRSLARQKTGLATFSPSVFSAGGGSQPTAARRRSAKPAPQSPSRWIPRALRCQGRRALQPYSTHGVHFAKTCSERAMD